MMTQKSGTAWSKDVSKPATWLQLRLDCARLPILQHWQTCWSSRTRSRHFGQMALKLKTIQTSAIMMICLKTRLYKPNWSNIGSSYSYWKLLIIGSSYSHLFDKQINPVVTSGRKCLVDASDADSEILSVMCITQGGALSINITNSTISFIKMTGRG